MSENYHIENYWPQPECCKTWVASDPKLRQPVNVIKLGFEKPRHYAELFKTLTNIYNSGGQLWASYHIHVEDEKLDIAKEKTIQTRPTLTRHDYDFFLCHL